MDSFQEARARRRDSPAASLQKGQGGASLSGNEVSDQCCTFCEGGKDLQYTWWNVPVHAVLLCSLTGWEGLCRKKLILEIVTLPYPPQIENRQLPAREMGTIQSYLYWLFLNNCYRWLALGCLVSKLAVLQVQRHCRRRRRGGIARAQIFL